MIVFTFTNPQGDSETIEVRDPKNFPIIFRTRYPDSPVPKVGEYEMDVRRPTTAEERELEEERGREWGRRHGNNGPLDPDSDPNMFS